MTGGSTASGRARLVDVAQRAGVSTATVSLVLRGRPGPSQATADAVRAAAADLGYRPDRTASLLARHRSHLLGVLLDVSSPFHAELVRALDSASADRGLDLVLGTTTPRTDEHRAAETLLDFRCEALVLLGPQMADADLTALASLCPTVVVGRAGVAGVTGVLAADDQGLEAAVDHLASLGHRRIAFVDGPRGSIARARRQGYRDAMARHGLGSQLDVIRGGANEDAEVDGAAAAARCSTRSEPATDRRRRRLQRPGRDRAARHLLRSGVRCRERLGGRLRRQPDGPARHHRPDLGQPGARGAGRCHRRARRGPARRRRRRRVTHG